MLGAYVSALGAPSKHYSVVIHNIGKARRRWAAMAAAGTKLALFCHGLEQETNDETAD